MSFSLNPGESVELEVYITEWNPGRKWWQFWKPIFKKRPATEAELSHLSEYLER